MLSGRRGFLRSLAATAVGLPSGAASLRALGGRSDAGGDRPITPSNAPLERRLDVALFFDVEDIYSPPEVGNDDSIKELATILTEEGLRGNFLFIGDRALTLQERGRRDVIESLAPHDVGLHTRSARHPTGLEYLAGMKWDEGVAEDLKHQREGAEIIRDVFGKPCAALSGHNVYDSAHALRAAALLKLPYVYSYPAAPPLYNLSWYAGALNLPYESPTLDHQLFRAYFEFDDVNYHSDAAFQARLPQLREHIELCLKERQPFLTLFLFHPQRVRLVDFIDHFWSPNGVNLPPEQWGKFGQPRRRTPEEVKTALANFRRLARWLRQDGRLNFLTVTQVAAKYGEQPATITHEELLAAAQKMAAAEEILHLPRFSPAEYVTGLARAVIHYADRGQELSSVPRDNVLGPTASPISVPELPGCSHAALVELGGHLLNHVRKTDSLPATLGPPLERVGVNHLYRALAQSYAAIHSGSPLAEVRFRRMPSWPPLGSPIGISYMRAVEGELVAPDVDGNTLYRDGKLQTWTLKPAVIP